MRKRFLFPLLVLVLLIGLFGVSAQAAMLDNGLVYKVYEDHVEITDYEGNASELIIPYTIDGLQVTSIGRNAFKNSENLISVTIPSSVITIGNDAFGSCSSLNYIFVDANNPNYSNDDRGVLFDKEKTQLIQAPGALNDSYTIPDSVITIGEYAFCECSKLTSVEIGDSVTSIDTHAFYDCDSLTTVEIGNSVVTIGHWAFASCVSLTDVVIPDCTTSIGSLAFYDCDSLTTVKIGDGVTTINGSAFWACGDLVNLTIGNSVISIGDNAFDSCVNLSSVKIPNSVITIGESAFNNCGMTSVEIGNSVVSIGESAFASCGNLTAINVDEGNPNYTNDERGVLFDKEKTHLIQAPGALSGSYTIPDSVTTISKNAFRECVMLTNVEIGDGVTSISEYAFANCDCLKRVVIPDSVTYIGYGAFHYCRGLTDVKIGSSVTTIGSSAFSYCYSLTNVVIPPSVTAIYYSAFIYCTKLTSISFMGDAPSLYSDAFSVVTATAYYPAGNLTWTKDVMQDYGGDITWVSHSHEYEANITAPTCTEQGYTTYTCSCGDSYVSDYVDALGHDYTDGTCTRCGAADPNYQGPTEQPFTDVPSGSYYEAPVLWALENGITTGATDTTFNPGGDCLRAQVVTFLHRAEGNPEPTSTKNPFTDVQTSDYFYAPVLWAVEEGITNGTSATKFGARDVCSRAAVVTFLWRAAGSPEPESTDNPFTDVPAGSFYEDAVLWAVENGVTTGISATKFGPTNPCNRAQVVTFLYRAYN